MASKLCWKLCAGMGLWVRLGEGRWRAWCAESCPGASGRGCTALGSSQGWGVGGGRQDNIRRWARVLEGQALGPEDALGVCSA